MVCNQINVMGPTPWKRYAIVLFIQGTAAEYLAEGALWVIGGNMRTFFKKCSCCTA